MKIKSALNEVSVWVYWTCNLICVLDVNAHNEQSCTGIEPAILSSAAELKHTALIIQSWRHISLRNNENYKDSWSNFVINSWVINLE